MLTLLMKASQSIIYKILNISRQSTCINFKAFVSQIMQYNVERWSPMKTGVYCRKNKNQRAFIVMT